MTENFARGLRRGRPYPEEVKAEAVRLLRKSRLAVEEIARRLGVKISALKGWACERSISLRWRSEAQGVVKQRGEFRTMMDRDRMLCEVALSNDATLAELAEHFDLTREGVRQVTIRWGVRGRRRGWA